MIRSNSWLINANCADIDPELFFDRSNVKAAKRVCSECLVAVECLTYALSISESPLGVWGGTTKYERDYFKHSNALRQKQRVGEVNE